jgi:hypothetical protein
LQLSTGNLPGLFHKRAGKRATARLLARSDALDA